MVHFIKCADGKERQIFPAKIKHKDKIRHFSSKFNASTAIANIMAVDDEKIKRLSPEKDKFNREYFFDETPYNAMMEMLVLAFGEHYSVAEIEEFVDVEMIAEILDIFYGLSGYKKKSETRATAIGTN